MGNAKCSNKTGAKSIGRDNKIVGNIGREKINSKKATIISAVIFSVMLPSLGMSAAHATITPQAINHINTNVIAIANTNVGRVVATTTRIQNNIIRAKYVSNSNYILVKYEIDGRWINVTHKIANNTIVILYPARVTQIFVRTLADSKGLASSWAKVKVVPKPTPVPSQYRFEYINTCEQYDNFVRHSGMSPEDPAALEELRNGDLKVIVKNTVKYNKSCERWGSRSISNDPIISLGKPTVASCSVVPLNDAPNGWTTGQIKSAYQYNKKGWILELVYPVIDEQKSFDTDVYWFGNEGTWTFGQKTHSGTYRWFTDKKYVPSDYGDSVTYDTQVVGSKPTFRDGKWNWVWNKDKTKALPEFYQKAEYPTQKVNSLNTNSTVRITKYFSTANADKDNLLDLNARIPVTIMSSATKYHGANYLPNIVVDAETLGYNDQRMVEKYFNPSHRNEPEYAGEYIYRNSIGGEEKSYTLNVQNICK